MKPLAELVAVGSTGEATVTVIPELTVGYLLPGMPKVFSTPAMIFLMETAAGNAVQASLPKGWVSVGVDVNIRHLAATAIGKTVTARATITAVGEKLVSFDVEAHAGEKLIGKGTHTRAPVELARFERSLSSK